MITYSKSLINPKLLLVLRIPLALGSLALATGLVLILTPAHRLRIHPCNLSFSTILVFAVSPFCFYRVTQISLRQRDKHKSVTSVVNLSCDTLFTMQPYYMEGTCLLTPGVTDLCIYLASVTRFGHVIKAKWHHGKIQIFEKISSQTDYMDGYIDQYQHDACF